MSKQNNNSVEIKPDNVTRVKLTVENGTIANTVVNQVSIPDTNQTTNTSEERMPVVNTPETGKITIYILNENDEPAEVGTRVILVSSNNTEEAFTLNEAGKLTLDSVDVGGYTLKEIQHVSYTV